MKVNVISCFHSWQMRNILRLEFNHTTIRRAKVQRFLAVLLNFCVEAFTASSVKSGR
ncbi:hypothetical protein LJPFL01_2475 [Lelliottia jeotgali]|nr:hypothetical protein LJPFL01_2475 [Lelliottia jeotgali]